jgi:hypothetical protein
MDNIHSKWRSTDGWQTVDFKTRQNFGEAHLLMNQFLVQGICRHRNDANQAPNRM